MINETTGAVGLDEIDKALVFIAIDVAAFLGAIIGIHALPIIHLEEWVAVFSAVVKIDFRSVNSFMLDSLGPHDG